MHRGWGRPGMQGSNVWRIVAVNALDAVPREVGEEEA